MKFKIKVKEEECNGVKQGLFQLSKRLGDKSYNVLVLCPLNGKCLSELKDLDGFEFEFSKEKLEEQKKKELLELIEEA